MALLFIHAFSEVHILHRVMESIEPIPRVGGIRQGHGGQGDSPSQGTHTMDNLEKSISLQHMFSN